MINTTFKLNPLARALAFGLTLSVPSIALAQESESAPKDADVEKIEVTGSLGLSLIHI